MLTTHDKDVNIKHVADEKKMSKLVEKISEKFD